MGISLGTFQETPESRFTKVREWHWPVVRHLYHAYSSMVDDVYAEYEELKKD